MRLAVYALTETGTALAREVSHALGAAHQVEVHLPERYALEGEAAFASLSSHVAETFSRYDGHVFIAATGIVVRLCAPLLKSKTADPAVVVLSQDGAFAISLLSGHLGGANALALEVAKSTGGLAVITTATDVEGLPAIDSLAREKGLHVANPKAIVAINAALLRGEKIAVCDPDNHLNIESIEDNERYFTSADGMQVLRETPSVLVSEHVQPDTLDMLVLHPKVLVAGIGCRRGCPTEDILRLVMDVFAQNRLAPESLAAVGSIDAKRNEPGLLQAAKSCGADVVFYPADELADVDVPTPSERVRHHMGVPGVSEAAALLLANGGPLLVRKTKSDKATIAVAKKIHDAEL